MANIVISKIKFRRGTNNQRKTIIFDQGEPVFTTDTKRLFVGNGVLSGGNIISSKIHPPLINYYSLSNVNAEIGDLVYVNNIYYQLTATPYSDLNSWANTGTKLDSTYFEYDGSNRVTLKYDSVSAINLADESIGEGLEVNNGYLQIDYDSTLNITSNEIGIADDGVNQNKIISSSFGNGISGGSGNVVELQVDFDDFYFDAGTLKLNPINTALTFEDLSATWFGDGIDYDAGSELISTVLTDCDELTITKDINGIISVDPSMFSTGLVFNAGTNTLSSIVSGVEGDGISRNSLGVISLSNIGSASSNHFSKITVDDYGRITDSETSIYDSISCISDIGGYNDTNTLSSIFNGSGDGLVNTNITKFSALSTNGTDTITLELSSSGFITVEQGITTKTGKSVNRFAIPIFRY